VTTVLRLDGVVAGYGSGDILKGVDLEVTAGTVTCLIGPNGAGKSTVLKTVSGLLRPRSGTVTFEGDVLNALTTRQRLLLGVVHVPQDRSLFPALTVWDNLLMGGYVLADQKLVRRRAAAAAEVFPICAQRKGERAGSLSGGEQKQVELARTLVSDSRLVLLDEPSIGLEPRSRRQVFESIRRLAATGRTVLLVEQNARSGLGAADAGAVLESGRVRLVGTGSELLASPEVARLYLGASSSAEPLLTSLATSSPSVDPAREGGQR